MAARNTGSEQLIKDTSKQVLFTDGKFSATTQDIADAAGVNRTLLNYYYRSRDTLINQVCEEAIKGFSGRFNAALELEISFAAKIENLINVFFEEAQVRPYTEIFLMTMMSEFFVFPTLIESAKMDKFLQEINEQMDAGVIEKMSPVNFVMNLFSLIHYPLMMISMYKALFNLNECNFKALIEERKTMIIQLILK